LSIWVALRSTTERSLLVASLTEEGFDARGFESTADVRAELASGHPPEVLLIDTGGSERMREELENIGSLAPDSLKVVITGLVTEPLTADLILQRPISVGQLAEKIKEVAGGIR
jgi:DNA-binding NtrC family response regulator